MNAIVTKRWGASLAVALRTEAKVTLLEDVPEVEVVIDGEEAGEEGKLARLVLKAVVTRLGEPEWGGRVETTSDIPSSRGLKSSSAAANAVALAANQAFERYEGKALARGDLLDAAIEAALDAGVTITGAFDDASASLDGGLRVTDNRERRVVHREAVPEDLAVLLLVPAAKTPTASVRDAMTLNGLVAGALYGVPAQWTREALAAGAQCAGVSGTGPAFAAVCEGAREKDVEAALLRVAPEGARILRTRPTNAREEAMP